VLDDQDEFEERFPAFHWGYTGSGKTDMRTLASLYGPNLRERLPKLFEYQKAFLNRIAGEGVPGAVLKEGRARKGQRKVRKTPLLSNTPRTTHGSVLEPSTRQHSLVSYCIGDTLIRRENL
jgi:hypothetical protein